MEEKNFVNMGFDEVFPPLTDTPVVQDSAYGSNELTEDDSQHMKYDTECEVHNSGNATYEYGFRNDTPEVVTSSPSADLRKNYQNPVNLKKNTQQSVNLKKDVSVEMTDEYTQQFPKYEKVDGNTAAIIYGLIAFICGSIPFFGLLVSILGIIKIEAFIKKQKQQENGRYSVAAIGLLFCWIGLVIAVFSITPYIVEWFFKVVLL